MTKTNTQTKIAELTTLVNSSKTQTIEGRQNIANSCKELYNLIEEDVYNADKEWMLKGMYNDLCNGNFAEPFMCEQKKSIFHTVVAIYNDRVLPNL
jgi:hypothetical protein